MPRAFPGPVLLMALVVSACVGRGPSATPLPSPSATPSVPRIGAVDLQAVVQAHPRWPEVDALNKKLAQIEAQLASPPSLPPVVQAQVQAHLLAQGRRMEAELRQEVTALQQRQQERLLQFVKGVRTEQEAKLHQLRIQIDAELQKEYEARLRALREELRQFELQVVDEYRFPIANLRLKADVVGVATEEELRRLTTELDRLQAERDAKIRTRAEVMDAVFRDFRNAKEAEASARLERAKGAAEEETRRLGTAKEREVAAETQRLVKARQRAFQARLNTFRRRLLGFEEGQLDAAQRRFVQGLRQREQQLLAERQALGEQRLRLEDSLLAEVKIEVATIAAARKLDVVLTRYQVNLAGEDITQEVIARMKR